MHGDHSLGSLGPERHPVIDTDCAVWWRRAREKFILLRGHWPSCQTRLPSKSGQVLVRTFGQGWDRNPLFLIPRLNAWKPITARLRPRSAALSTPKSGQVLVRSLRQGWDRNLLSLIPPLNAIEANSSNGPAAVSTSSRSKKRTGFGPHLCPQIRGFPKVFGGYVRSSELDSGVTTLSTLQLPRSAKLRLGGRVGASPGTRRPGRLISHKAVGASVRLGDCTAKWLLMGDGKFPETPFFGRYRTQ